MGGFPLPYGKVRLFIKEPKAEGDAVRSQAFLGEDWAQYTPLFAPLDLYVGTAQDVKVERFQMDPEGGVRNAFDELAAPRYTLDGKEGVTKPLFRNVRSRVRYRLQNFKTEKGDPITVPLTIKEHVEGQWIIEKVVLKEILGERNDQKEKEIPFADVLHGKADRRQQRRIRDQAAADDDRQEVRPLRDDAADVRPRPAAGCALAATAITGA